MLLLSTFGILVTVAYQSSDQALPVLMDQVSTRTPTQVAVAKTIRVEFPPELPRLVAAAWLRDGLSEALGTATSSNQSDGQRALLEDLADDLSIEAPKTRTRAEAEAWIQHCFLLKRIRAHREIRLERGDLVRRLGDHDDAIDKVSSIDSQGRVWLRGRSGQRWPDQLEVVVRASDSDHGAIEARRIAENRRAAVATKMLNKARRSELARFCPTETATADDLDGLRYVIDNASDERPIQAYLDACPQLLASILQGQHRYVRSKVRLGDKYETDYMIADADSAGMHWIYVELETPKSPVLLKDGTTLHDKARTGVAQVRNWREWIAKNLAYANQLHAENGLGLPGIRAGDEGLVLVGRREYLRDDPANVRRQLYEEARIAVRTYGWLLTTIEWSMSTVGPPPGASYVLRLDLDD